MAQGVYRLRPSCSQLRTYPGRLTAHFNQFGQKSLTRACESKSQIIMVCRVHSTYFSAMSKARRGDARAIETNRGSNLAVLWGGFGQSFQLLFSNKLVYSLRFTGGTVDNNNSKKNVAVNIKYAFMYLFITVYVSIRTRKTFL